MRYAAKWLGLIAATAVMVPLAEIPGFFGEPRNLMPAALAQSDEDRKAEADRLLDQGIQQFNASQFREAIQSWEQALKIYRETGVREAFLQESRRSEGLALGNLGNAYYSLGDYHQAIEFYEQSLAIAREIGDRGGEGRALGNLGDAYFSLGDFRRAIEFHEQGLAIFHEIGDRHPDVARNLNNLARLFQAQGRYGEAELLYQEALTIFREQLGDSHPDVAQSLNNLASLYQEQGRYGEAESLFLEALAIWRQQLGADHPSIAPSLNNLALLYQAQGRYGEAEPLYQEALEIARTVGDRDLEVNNLRNLGANSFQLREYSESIRFYEQELALHREIGHRSGEGNTLLSLGWSYAFQSQYELALDYFNDARNISKELGDDNKTANTLYALGWTHHSLGDFNRTLELYQSALNIFEDNNNKNGTLNILNGLGWVYIDLGQTDLAINLFLQQLDASRLLSSRRQEANALNGLGFAYTELNEYQIAIDYSKQALEIHREINDVREEAYALGDIGNAHAALGNYQTALNYLTECLLIQRRLNNRWGEGRTLSAIAQVFRDQQQLELAITFLKASVTVREAIREDIRNLDVDLRQSFTDTVSDDYRLLAELLLNQGRIPEAQQVLDLLQLEELREFTHTRADWTGTALAYTDPEQTVIDAHGSLIALGGRILECEATNCADLNDYYAQMEALKEQYDRQVEQFVETIRANRAADDVFQDPDTLSGDAENLLAAYAEAGETAVLIYPFVLQDKLWLVWATAGNVIGSVEVPVPQGELSAAVQRFGELLNRPGAGSLTDLQAASQRLYSWIVQPLEEELEKTGVDHLIFVNDRVTRYIPMAALFDGERFLLDRYRISTVLSPAVTETGGRLGPVDDSQVLGLGLTQAVADFSPLPAVAEELKAIVRDDSLGAAGIFPGRVFLDDDFTLEALRDNVMHHRVLHMATHAAFVPGRAQDSFIVLGNGDRLSIPDINTIERRLRNLHLVVLSACQTALGGPAADGNGTEIAGLSSYFLRPGRAETVIASLWKVNDNSTSVLMQRFYELLATGELTKAEALRQAQLSLLYNEDTATRLAASRGNIVVETRDGTPLSAVGSQHPYHWAPFILIGNGL